MSGFRQKINPQEPSDVWFHFVLMAIVLQALAVDKKKRHLFSRRLLFTKSKERSKSENALTAEVSKGSYMTLW